MGGGIAPKDRERHRQVTTRNFELRELRYFVAVAEELHFRRAADRLRVAQPALSQSILRLEAKLGVTLFRRSTRSVGLTEAGEILLEDARRVLADADALADHAERLGNDCTGQVTIGYGPHVRLTSAELIGRFGATHPAVEISHRQQYGRSLIGELQERRIDIAVVLEQPFPDALTFEPLFDVALIALVSSEHPLGSRDTIAFTDLDPFWLPLVKDGDLHHPLESLYRDHGMTSRLFFIDDPVASFPMALLERTDLAIVLTREYPHPQAGQITFDPPVTWPCGVLSRPDGGVLVEEFLANVRQWGTERHAAAVTERLLS
jgi:DNA-binding transcriptional LysR family regulator